MAREITGSLFRRAKVFWCKFKYQGHEYRFSLKTAKAGHAEHELDRQMTLRKATILDGTFAEKYGSQNAPITAPVVTGKLPISKIWQYYLGSMKRPDSGQSTLRQYQFQVGKFVTWLKDQRPQVQYLSQVDQKVTEDFAKYLRTWTAAGTFNKYITILGLVFRTLSKDAGITENPWIEITKLKNRPNNRRDFTEVELTSIFTKAEGDILTMCLLGYYTALRLGDACMLEWAEVSLKTRQITRVPLKTARTTGKCVVVPIHKDLLTHLVSLSGNATTKYVCPEMSALYQNDTTKVSAELKKFFEKCGIRLHREGTGPEGKRKSKKDPASKVHKRAVVEAGFHSFRHTFVSRSSEQGMDSASIRAIVGWGNPQMEKIYNHVSQSHLEQGIRNNKSILGGGTQAVEKASPVVDVAAMDTESLVLLMKTVDAELKRRESQSIPVNQRSLPSEPIAIPA